MPEFQRPSWPNGAACAVTLTFDNFGESLDLLRYGHAGGANADGVYSPRRGIQRTLDLLDRYSIKATFFLEGWNVRKYGSLAKEIVDQGHEVAAHGWMHERWNELDRNRERELIDRTTQAIEDAIGTRPNGWRSPAGLTTPWTLEALHEAGYSYDSSFGDDDVPYLLETGQQGGIRIPQLPWTWALDDAAYYAYPGSIRRPDEVIDLWIDEFAAAYELTGYFMLVLHPRYSGRPTRIRALERLINVIKERSALWFARCDEVADHIRNAPETPCHAAPEQFDSGLEKES
jgi:peptidoglycan-N-acetylglucosamine deacetylase